MDNPPKGSYFKKSCSPVTLEKQTRTVITPVKAAELKTMYISQVKEFHSLLKLGAITDSDFQKQKCRILELMDKT